MTPRPDGFNVAADDPRGPNCGLTAIAIVSGLSYKTVEEAYRIVYTPNKRWKGGTHHKQRVFLLRLLEVPFTESILKRKVKVRTFVNLLAEPGKTYILRHRGHVCTLRDGWIADQRGPVEAWTYKYKNCFVTHVLEITP
jgi:hypothetical protein